MSRDVCIIGAGMTKFGENFDKSLRDLSAEAVPKHRSHDEDSPVK